MGYGVSLRGGSPEAERRTEEEGNIRFAWRAVRRRLICILSIGYLGHNVPLYRSKYECVGENGFIVLQLSEDSCCRERASALAFLKPGS